MLLEGAVCRRDKSLNQQAELQMLEVDNAKNISATG